MTKFNKIINNIKKEIMEDIMKDIKGELIHKNFIKNKNTLNFDESTLLINIKKILKKYLQGK